MNAKALIFYSLKGNGMAKFSKSDLLTLQRYPLSVKIGRTQARIMEFHRELNGRFYISLSGGKDSTILLHIVRQMYPEIPAVFVDTGLEYPEIRRFVKGIDNVEWLRPNMRFSDVISQYGYPVVGKEAARTIYYAKRGSEWAIQKMNGNFKDGTPSTRYQRFKKYRYLIDAPFPVSSQCCEELKKKPLRKFERENKLFPMTAVMAEESFLRQTSWMNHGCNSFDSKRIMSAPMAFWTEQDALAYIKLTGIPYSEIYGDIVPKNNQQSLFAEDQKLMTTGCRRTGCFACMFGVHLERGPNRFQKMFLTHPKLHYYCIHTLGCGQVMDYMGINYFPASERKREHDERVEESEYAFER